MSTEGVALGPQARSRSIGSWGMVMLITTEAMIFAALLSAYFFVRANSPEWPEGGIAPPKLWPIALFTVVLLASSLPLLWGEAAIRRNRVGQLRVALAVSWLLGAAFVVNQVIEFHTLEFSAKDNAYASLFVVITGLHGLHLVAGLLMSLVVQIKASIGWFDAGRHQTVTLFSMYWHFVDAVWIFVFASLYLTAHIR
ncbi:MAG: cytochrome c oxidase, subunit [Ilumatobacteraceae bacterium]|nr:cytochrome c oxidase, subunit [Ilumatobacteraceae bacterium]